MTGRKVCTRCKLEKYYAEFNRQKDTKDGYHCWCRKCVSAYRSDKHTKQVRDNQDHNMKKRYGLSIIEYNHLFSKQQGCCAICGKHQSEFSRRLAVDHNHKTSVIRGLLCSRCNFGLGYFEGWAQEFRQQINGYIKENE